MNTQIASSVPASFMRRLGFGAALAFISACGGPRFEQRPPVELPSSVSEGGETIYFGTVYPLGDAGSEPSFRYERRVSEQGGALVSSHITRDTSGAVAFADSATHTDDYRLIEYTLHGNQMGQRGTIRVQDGRVAFHLLGDDGERSHLEQQAGTVVVGPTLVGYIARHLDALRAGQVLPIRLALPDRLETIGFELTQEEAPAGQTRVKMKPSSFFIGLMVDPIHYTFETSSGNLVRMEGRVPPKVRSGERWSDLDARVEYEFVAASYR